MNDGQMAFSQVMAHGSRFVLDRCIRRNGGYRRVKSFSCRDQYLAMAFAQLTYREILRDIEACLGAAPDKLYHLGFRSSVARSTLADANEKRNERGLTGVQLLVSDAHTELAKARREPFPGVNWQRCHRHFLMNALEKAPKALKDELHRRLRRIRDHSQHYENVRDELSALAVDLEDAHPKLAEWLEIKGEETITCLHFPEKHRRRIRTTNCNERINQELLRRSRSFASSRTRKAASASPVCFCESGTKTGLPGAAIFEWSRSTRKKSTSKTYSLRRPRAAGPNL